MDVIRQLRRAAIVADQLWQSRKLPVDLDGFTVDKPVFFIGGSGRSGTTLLRLMLGAHPEIYAGPELNVHANILYRLSEFPFLPRKAFMLYSPEVVRRLSDKFSLSEEDVCRIREKASCLADFINALLTRCAEKNKRAYWLEKTPWNANILPFIFKYFPKAKFIHVIRDGRDAICSLRRYKSFEIADGERVASEVKNSLEKSAALWVHDVSNAMRFRGHSGYHEVRYRDLVLEPEMTLRKACAFLGITFDPAVLKHDKYANESGSDFIVSSANAVRPPNTKSLGRWKTDLTHEEAMVVQEKAGELLEKLGYIQDGNWTEACI